VFVCTVRRSENYSQRQVKVCNIYKNTNLKLIKTGAAIWFNKVCKIKHIKPNYIHFRSSSQSVLPYTHHWLKNYAAKHRLTFWSRNFTFKF